MNKAELIKSIAEKAELTAKDAAKFLDAFLATTTETLASGDTVALIGFGTFSQSQRAERTARNFQTKEMMNIPASKSVKFKVGKVLKDAVNK